MVQRSQRTEAEVTVQGEMVEAVVDRAGVRLTEVQGAGVSEGADVDLCVREGEVAAPQTETVEGSNEQCGDADASEDTQVASEDTDEEEEVPYVNIYENCAVIPDRSARRRGWRSERMGW